MVLHSTGAQVQFPAQHFSLLSPQTTQVVFNSVPVGEEVAGTTQPPNPVVVASKVGDLQIEAWDTNQYKTV